LKRSAKKVASLKIMVTGGEDDNLGFGFGIVTCIKHQNMMKALFFSVENLGCEMGECGKGGEGVGESW